MKSEILVIAEAILANIHVLEMLVAKLPDESAAKVKEIVAAPVAAKKPVEVEIPVLVPAKVEAAPIPTVVVAPVVVPAAPVATCPITNGKELMDFVMSAFKAMGPEKGARIQEVLQSIGCAAINEVRPDQYAALHAGIEVLKAA